MEPLRSGDPTDVGRYRTMGRLGSGGMGVVYLAEGPRGTVALKLVRAELGDDWSFRARFRREVQSCFRVSSVHTAKLIDFDTEAEQPWMATEFVDGRSLDQLVEANGPLSPDDQLALATGLSQALVAIHDEDVIHRDLKPANVLLTHAGPKVIDFGIAAAADAARITSRGLMVGSPGWLAPEQIESGDATPASDIFALGLVLCFAASGEPPFGSGTTDALLYRAMNSAPNVPLDRLARPLHRLVLAAISRSPVRRPTAAQLLEYLSDAGVGTSTTVSQRLLEDRLPEGDIGKTRQTSMPSMPSYPPPTPPPARPTPPPTYPTPTYPTPPPYPPTPPPTPSNDWPPRPADDSAARRRPAWIIPTAVVGVLVVAGGAVGLILGLGGSKPEANPSPRPTSSPSASATPSVAAALSAEQQGKIATAALVRNGDFPTAVKSVERKAIALPCNAADQSIPSSALLKGEFTDTTSGTSSTGRYVSETVAVFPTASAAEASFSSINDKLATCHTYPYTFQNQTDTVTVTKQAGLGAGDDSLYVEEKYTPQNYKGPVTSTSASFVRRGPVIIRLYTYENSQADAAVNKHLATTLVSRVDAAS